MRVFGQRRIGVRIEAVTIDRVTVDRSCRRRDKKDETVVLDYTNHFLKHEPEELAVLESLPRNDKVETAVRRRDVVRVFENYVHAVACRQVRGDIVDFWIAENVPVRPVDVAAADVKHFDAFVCLDKARSHEFLVTSRHVLERRGVHFSSSKSVRFAVSIVAADYNLVNQDNYWECDALQTSSQGLEC